MTATVAHFVKNKDIKKEGYLLRKAKKKNKLTRDWFSLLDRELYYYKSKKEAQHKNLYILVGVYITKEEPEMFQDELKLYPFTLVFPHKSRTFYCIKESECNGWIKVLKEAVGYSDFFDFYELGEIIGRGKFSVVKNAIHLKTKKKVAVKILPKTEKTKKDLELQKREIEILKICQHPNIIRLLDIFENESTLFLVIEYLPGGDMFDFLQERGFDIKESQAKNYVKKIATALTYLHSFGIAYRDLKPENILMSSSDDTADIKISDFGLSKIIAPNERSDEPFGTISYAAPEVLLGNSYDKSVDLWSLGVVTYLLVSGTLPFDDDNEDLIIERAIKEEPDYKSPWIAKVSKNCKDFIKKLLSKGNLSFSLPLTVFLFLTLNCSLICFFRRCSQNDTRRGFEPSLAIINIHN
jgi:calcium/calmodulin-dependent protein kinase I